MKKMLVRILAIAALLAAQASATSFAAEFSATPINVSVVPAFPKLRVYRPIVVTHAGDGSDRIFIASQDGVVHFIPNNQDVTETTQFLNIKEKVVYKDRQNEEGLLGLAFHPNYKENGHLFVYYTTTDAPHTSVVSRFTVSKDDPNKVDPATEMELFRLKQPFWNHNGGTVVFGPDGHLYIALGDGGKADDPLRSGQNLSMWLGSILRIDVDKKANGKNYAIPADNPFVDREGAKPEIWAYGFRNVWRMSFDRETGTCWAGDVGQNKWEEIDIVRAGGNYGWSVREGLHAFHKEGQNKSDPLVDPVYEYDHEVGKSITGGVVYRGKRAPALTGKYLYADYVTGAVWGLDYDVKQKKVRGNYSIKAPKLPVITFGEDEAGEVYLTSPLGGGRLYMFAPTK